MAPSIIVEPAVALIDVERSITISGFPPYSVVTVTASMQMCGIGWRSSSVFLADQDGSLDLERDCPVEGDYAVPSSMGIVWSMKCDDVTHAVFPPNRTDALQILIEASDGQQRAFATLTQTFLADGVQHESIRTQCNGMSISGELYTPATPGPHPLVIYMNGSSGAVNAPRAALFAAHGYQCLALAIFNYEGRPRYLNDMPLEYFQQALLWARETLQPRDGFVALSGISRGAETSLLVASHFPELVSAVIAYVPSAVTHGVVSAGEPSTGRNAQVWTLNGEPLPHLWQNNGLADWEAAYAFEPPYRQTKAFLSATRDRSAFERARIPVERFPGPTMLISASDDGFWPSTAYSELIAKQRESHDLPTEHYICEGAGHHVHYPYLPTTLIAKPHAMSGLLLDAGGTAVANAVGYEGSYWASLDFLERAQQLVTQ